MTTEERLPEEDSALEASLRERVALLEHLGCGVWLYDGEDVSYVNPELTRITGFTTAELLSPRFFQDLILPEYVGMIVDRGRRRIRGEPVPDHYEVAIRRADGELAWLDLHAQPVLVAGRTYSLVTAWDMTERKLAEEAIARSEERLRLAQSASRMGSWEWDMRTNEITWSAELELLYGMTPGAFSGTFDEFVERIHPEDRAALLASVESLAATGSHEIDHRVTMPNGEVRWLAARGRVFYDDAGNGVRAIGVGMDITEKKRTEEELASAYAAKDELLGLVSHELRTPLTQILGFSSALLRHRHALSDVERDAALGDLHLQAQRLQRLVENMLVLARVEAGPHVALEPLLVQRVLPAIAAEHTEQHPHRDVRLSLAPSLPPVLAVPTYFEQMVSNLLNNAEKYSPKDQPITVLAEPGEGEVTVRVLDRGKGIADTELESVFEAFFRAPDSATVSGIGLGLAVCRRLASVQGRRIWAHSREGGGTAMAFTLKLAD